MRKKFNELQSIGENMELLLADYMCEHILTYVFLFIMHFFPTCGPFAHLPNIHKTHTHPDKTIYL